MSRQSCRQQADPLRIGKTAVAKIIKIEASICKEYEHFKGNVKRTERDNFIR